MCCPVLSGSGAGTGKPLYLTSITVSPVCACTALARMNPLKL